MEGPNPRTLKRPLPAGHTGRAKPENIEALFFYAGHAPKPGARVYILRGPLIHTALGIFGPSMAFLGVRGGSEMIVSHRASSSFNMSSYRAVWKHFKPNSMIFINLNTLQMIGIWDRFMIGSR